VGFENHAGCVTQGRVKKCLLAVLGSCWLLVGSPARAQTDLETLEQELGTEQPPAGAEVPQPGDDPSPEELEPPPLEPAEAPHLAEDEINVGDPAAQRAGVSLGVLVGWGFASQRPGPWTFGFGVHGGYTAGNHLHLGAKFVYFLGEQRRHLFDFGMEVGYSLQFGIFRLIPTAGVGIAFVTVGEATQPHAYLAPGSYLRFEFDGFYVGADVRGQFVFSDPKGMALVSMGMIGLSY
jgi:hypothetical protein